jgi:hypothetical protein
VQKLAELCAATSGYLILNDLRATPEAARTVCFMQRLSGSKHGAKKKRAGRVTRL